MSILMVDTTYLKNPGNFPSQNWYVDNGAVLFIECIPRQRVIYLLADSKMQNLNNKRRTGDNPV